MDRELISNIFHSFNRFFLTTNSLYRKFHKIHKNFQKILFFLLVFYKNIQYFINL
ncbi:hypothetical protein P344_03705 [Spiroplasma mirum ATCC 29335]|uniref:Uncharacterized protein n=1 Tax=Spiroplasma mirum ATCC 29335 TaxID=838561 RepID=W0GLJ0_9MOLU|nr:hypothetical protein SMM_0625 [Spiroplasma mirum ATCC 29335]AHI58082.1 hypothetical protein P344_03705 [Spiroplasma mirum ATCC 29335]